MQVQYGRYGRWLLIRESYGFSLSNSSVYNYEDSSPPKSTNSIPFVMSGWWIRSLMNSIPIDDRYHGIATDVHRIGQACQIHGMNAAINLEWNYLVWQSNISPTLTLLMTIRICLHEPYSIVKTTAETPMTRYNAIVQVSDVTIVDWSSPMTCGGCRNSGSALMTIISNWTSCMQHYRSEAFIYDVVFGITPDAWWESESGCDKSRWKLAHENDTRWIQACNASQKPLGSGCHSALTA